MSRIEDEWHRQRAVELGAPPMTSPADTPANCWSEGQSHDFLGGKCRRCGATDTPATPAAGTPNEVRFKIGDQWYYRGNRSASWFAVASRPDGSCQNGICDRIEQIYWPWLEVVAELTVKLAAANERLAAVEMENEEYKRILLGQFADVKVGDFVRCRTTLAPGSGIVIELIPSHRMIKLENGWCLHQKDTLIEHIPPNTQDRK